MPAESLILRRSYPVPVTFADLRRAAVDADLACALGVSPRSWSCARNRKWPVVGRVSVMWHAAIKNEAGATDDIFAIIDGHEVRVATVIGSGESATANLFGCISAGQAAAVLIAADEAGYWERPHEVRVVLQERQVSVSAVERAVNVGWTARGGSA